MDKCICGKSIEEGRRKFCSEECRKEQRRKTWREFDKKRNKTLKRKDWWISYYNKRKNNEEFKEKERKRLKNWWEKNKEREIEKRKEKKVIWDYAYKNLREGIIKERENKCEFCGSKNKLHLHHKDYSDKKDKEKILLLCPKCHKLLHTRGTA